MKKVTIILSALLLLSASCRQPIKHDKLVEYIAKPSHGLKQADSTGRLKISVAYRPSAFLIEQELQAKPGYNQNTVDSLSAIYNKNLYFVLSMSYNGQEILTSFAGDAQKFSEMVNTLSFGMGGYVSLTTSGNDTLGLLDYAYPRAYGMSSGTDMLFAFENKIKPGVKTLFFNIADFGLGMGKKRFEFRVKDIKNVPSLEFKYKKKK